MYGCPAFNIKLGIGEKSFSLITGPCFMSTKYVFARLFFGCFGLQRMRGKFGLELNASETEIPTYMLKCNPRLQDYGNPRKTYTRVFH